MHVVFGRMYFVMEKSLQMQLKKIPAWRPSNLVY